MSKGGIVMCKRTPLVKGKEISFDRHSFRIGDVCGYGTSSIVYYAEDIGNNYQVIVKEIYPAGLSITRASDGSLQWPDRNRFKVYIDRAKNALEMQKNLHNDEDTNHVTSFTYAKGAQNDTFYCASQYNAGCTLKKWINDNRNNSKFIHDLLQICSRIADVLKKYHKKELIHLDIKPANILVVPIDEKINYIQMFDFDSVYRLEELKNNYVRYSPGYAAPEVMYFPYNIDIDHTDIFSVGAILYEGIFGKPHEDEETEVWHRFDFSEVRALNGFSPELKPKLTEILKKTLSIVVSSRFTAGELHSALNDAVNIAEKDLFIPDDDIRSSEPVSRIEDLEMIHKEFENKKAAYIHGIRGSGKSVLARKYAEQFRNEYTTVREIIFDSDSGISAEKTICQQLLNKSKKITIKHICDNILGKVESKTLILLINFEANDANNDILAQMLKASNENVRFIITSRNTHDCIKNIDNKYLFEMSSDILSDSLKQDITTAFFEIADKKGKFDDAGRKYFKMFLKGINYHFLTVFLIAELSGDILRTSQKKYPAFLKTLKEQGISSPEIRNRKDERFFEEIIKIILEQKAFSEGEKKIVLNAALLPPFGMPEGEFLEYIDADIIQTIGISPKCDALVSGSWLRRETRNDQNYISMHPIIKEVCISELILEAQEPFDFDPFIPLLQGLSSKLDLSAENISELPEVMKFGLLYAIPVCKKLSDLISRAKVRNPETNVSEEIRRLMNDIEKKCNRNIFGIFRNKSGEAEALKFLSQNANFP